MTTYVSKIGRVLAVVVLVFMLALSNPPYFQTRVSIAQSSDLWLSFMTYNLHGDQTILPAVVNHITSLWSPPSSNPNPEVIVFTEVTNSHVSTLRQLFRDKGKIYNTGFAPWLQNNSSSPGVAVFSRYPLESNAGIKRYTFNNSTRVIFTPRLLTPKGPIRVFAHHPDPGFACQSANVLRTYRQTFSDDFVFLLGDFNLDPVKHSCWANEIAQYFVSLCNDIGYPYAVTCLNTVNTNYYNPPIAPGLIDHIMVDVDDHNVAGGFNESVNMVGTSLTVSDHFFVFVSGVVR